jgi:hypothetical protein
MKQLVICPNQETGGICVLMPADCGLSIHEIALKDIPQGLPFKIIDCSEFTEEQAQLMDEFFSALEADFSEPDGYGLGYEGWIEWKAQQENE